MSLILDALNKSQLQRDGTGADAKPQPLWEPEIAEAESPPAKASSSRPLYIAVGLLLAVGLAALIWVLLPATAVDPEVGKNPLAGAAPEEESGSSPGLKSRKAPEKSITPVIAKAPAKPSGGAERPAPIRRQPATAPVASKPPAVAATPAPVVTKRSEQKPLLANRLAGTAPTAGSAPEKPATAGLPPKAPVSKPVTQVPPVPRVSGSAPGSLSTSKRETPAAPKAPAVPVEKAAAAKPRVSPPVVQPRPVVPPARVAVKPKPGPSSPAKTPASQPLQVTAAAKVPAKPAVAVAPAKPAAIKVPSQPKTPAPGRAQPAKPKPPLTVPAKSSVPPKTPVATGDTKLAKVESVVESVSANRANRQKQVAAAPVNRVTEKSTQIYPGDEAKSAGMAVAPVQNVSPPSAIRPSQSQNRPAVPVPVPRQNQAITMPPGRSLAALQKPSAPVSRATGSQPQQAVADDPGQQKAPYADIPLLEMMPYGFRKALPAIAVNVYVYKEEKADSFVLINMRKYRQGDRTKEGVMVREIAAKNLILEYQGKRFRIER